MANYIKYGTLQVDLDSLMTKLADRVLPYINNQPWSSKKKERFMNAYLDIMSRGVTGADNSTGLWMLSTGGDLIEYKNKKDKEAYEQAAYFIQLGMSDLSTDVEEEEKTNLPILNNEEFTTSFINQISNNIFGGRDFDTQNDWNSLDERSTNGLRASTNRANKLAEELQKYSESLTEGKYNFEGSPFKDLNDLKTRLNNAITILRSHDEENYTSALNAIGLRASDWFNDGSGDIYGLDSDGNPITYGLYLEALEAQQALQLLTLLAEQETAAKLAEQEAKAKAGVLSSFGGVHSKEARLSPKAYQEWLANTYGTGQEGFNGINNRVSLLLEGAYSGSLDAKGRKELGNLLYYIRTNNPNYKGLGFGLGTNVNDDEWAELRKHTNRLSSVIRENFVRLPYQTSDGRYTYADNQGNVYFLKPTNHKKFKAPSVNRSKAYLDYKNNFLKSLTLLNNEKPVLSLDTDILISDITSILGDVVSLGGGYAGAAGGVATLVSDLYGDLRRGKDTWDTIKNLGKNLAWGVAGVIPGSRLGKLARNASRVVGSLSSAGILTDPEIHKSWMKLVNGEDITAKDFENFKWTLHAVTGGVNIARGVATNRNISKKVQGKPTVETTTGKKVSLTEKQVAEINKIGSKKGLKAAEKKFMEYSKGEAPKAGSFKFLEEPRSWYNPNRYSQRLRNWTSEDKLLIPTKSGINVETVNHYLELDRNKPIIGIGNPLKAKFWTEAGPNRGGLTWALSPYRTAATTLTTEASLDNQTQNNSPARLEFKPTKLDNIRSINKFLNNFKQNKGHNTSNDLILNVDSESGTVNLGGGNNIIYFKHPNNTYSATWTINGKSYSKQFKTVSELKQRMAKLANDLTTKRNGNKRLDPANVAQMLRLMSAFKLININKKGGKLITDTQIDKFLNQYK